MYVYQTLEELVSRPVSVFSLFICSIATKDDKNFPHNNKELNAKKLCVEMRTPFPPY